MRINLIRLALAASSILATPAMAAPAQISWDNWGIPHIQADSEEAALKAFGWAQMEAHGDLILNLYGRARGRAAEYWGETRLDSDKLILQLGIPERAVQWSAALPGDQKRKLDAFVAGMNAYARAHPEKIGTDKRAVLPITSLDPLMHMQQLIHLTFIGDTPLRGVKTMPLEQKAPDTTAANPKGSNGYAIAPSRSADGKAMLVINPHLPWNDLFTWFEAQLASPASNIYGAAEVGVPFIALGFSEHGGWTHTVNQFDGADLYSLTLEGNRYLYDGAWRDLERKSVTLKVRGTDGQVKQVPFVVESSVHAPLIRREGNRALALRIAGLDCFGVMQQYWDMAAARDVDEFERAESRQQMPFFNSIYSSRKGNIFYQYGGRFPDRKVGDHKFWSGIIPGDSSEFLWSGTIEYAKTPHFRDPPGGFIQNANDPPWFNTWPAVLRPEDYPAHMIPPPSMDMRAQHSLRQLLADTSISFDELVAMQLSNRLELADRLLPQLLSAARLSKDNDVAEARKILEGWDYYTHSDSVGAPIFVEWGRLMFAQGEDRMFATRWDRTRPLSTPAGLADPTAAVDLLAQAARNIRTKFGRLDIPYGDTVRLKLGTYDLPASGGPAAQGSFRTTWPVALDGGLPRVVGGDSFVAVVSFGDRVRAVGVLPYGNATQPGSPHIGDQLELFSKEKLRPIYFYPEEVKANSTRMEQVR